MTPALRHLHCNALMQPHFYYACPVWYPNLTKKLKHTIQTTLNRGMCFSLQLDKFKHISHKHNQNNEKLNMVLLGEINNSNRYIIKIY